MEDRHAALENSSPLEPFIDRFAKELVQERIAHGHIDLRTMSFAQMEILSHQIAKRVAQHLGHEMTSRQAELHADDYNCPTCGLECEALRHKRTVHSIDGETEVVELRSYCPKCRRYFFPCASRHRPR